MYSMAGADLSPQEQLEIVQVFKENPSVFERVYSFYYEMILRYLAKRTMSSELAYDLTADTFVKAYESFHKFEYRNISIKAWLYRIAINTLKNSYRRPVESVLDDISESHPNLVTDLKEELEDLDQALFGDEKLTKLSDAIATLNSDYQNIISLYYFSEMSQEEIGKTINRSTSAVKSMMHRAMTHLRDVLIP